MAGRYRRVCAAVSTMRYSRGCLRVPGTTRISARVSFSYVPAQFPRVMTHRTRQGVPARDESCDRTFSRIDSRNGAKQYFAIAGNFLFHGVHSRVPFNIKVSRECTLYFKRCLGYREIAKLCRKYRRDSEMYILK